MVEVAFGKGKAPEDAVGGAKSEEGGEVSCAAFFDFYVYVAVAAPEAFRISFSPAA